ncbi:MAG: hypothetical protein J7647_32235 [Cyanobacteria bacterium SBLK]|nr:hypothetical protein [Cyanobacteria bacterium SBLK]
MATPSFLTLDLTSLSLAQQTVLEGQSLVLGSAGVDLRLLLQVLPGQLQIERQGASDPLRWNTGDAYFLENSLRPLTYKISVGGAHGRIVTDIFEILYAHLRNEAAQRNPATLNLTDPTDPMGTTVREMALMGIESPQDGMVGDELRFVNGVTIELQELP